MNNKRESLTIPFPRKGNVETQEEFLSQFLIFSLYQKGRQQRDSFLFVLLVAKKRRK